MTFWRSLSGEVLVELITADPAGSLAAIAQMGLPIRQVLPEGELTLSFRIRRQNLKALNGLAVKRGEKLTIQRYLGLYYTFRSLFRRRLLLMGVSLLLLSALLIPTRILFFRVTGNSRIPAGEILAAAEDCGLRFGVNRRGLRSEKIKNSLLSIIPELKWVGVNTYGCVAEIRVAEKPPSVPMEQQANGLSHLAAARDGVIQDVTVTRGTALCAPGQTVTQGEILISGLMDCGITQKATVAQGEVTALTSRSFFAVTPENRLVRDGLPKKVTRWSLVLGKKRIKLWIGSGIWGTECDRMYQEYQLTLPGGFRLPVALAADRFCISPLREEAVPETEAGALLRILSESSLKADMLAGMIQKKQEALSHTTGRYCLTGAYTCREVISRRIWEQIGDTNE